MSDNALFGNYVEMRAWRAAFAAMLEEENSEELDDKIPWHIRLKDLTYERINRNTAEKNVQK